MKQQLQICGASPSSDMEGFPFSPGGTLPMELKISHLMDWIQRLRAKSRCWMLLSTVLRGPPRPQNQSIIVEFPHPPQWELRDRSACRAVCREWECPASRDLMVTGESRRCCKHGGIKKSRSLLFASLRCAAAAWSASGACVIAHRRNEREERIGLQSEQEQ